MTQSKLNASLALFFQSPKTLSRGKRTQSEHLVNFLGLSFDFCRGLCLQDRCGVRERGESVLSFIPAGRAVDSQVKFLHRGEGEKVNSKCHICCSFDEQGVRLGRTCTDSECMPTRPTSPSELAYASKSIVC